MTDVQGRVREYYYLRVATHGAREDTVHVGDFAGALSESLCQRELLVDVHLVGAANDLLELAQKGHSVSYKGEMGLA